MLSYCPYLSLGGLCNRGGFMGMCEVLTELSFIQSAPGDSLGEHKQKNTCKHVYVVFFLIPSSFLWLPTPSSAFQSCSRLYILGRVGVG